MTKACAEGQNLNEVLIRIRDMQRAGVIYFRASTRFGYKKSHKEWL